MKTRECAVFLWVVCALPCTAQVGAASKQDDEASQQPIRTYHFADSADGSGSDRDRDRIRGRVKRVENGTVHMKVYLGPATYDEDYEMSAFTPRSRFRIMEALTSPEDVQAQLKLVRFALIHDLPHHAKLALKKARRTHGDEDLGEKYDPMIRAKAAAMVVKEFHEALDEGRTRTARLRLEEIDRHHGDAVPEEKRARLRSQLKRTENELDAKAAARRAQHRLEQRDEDFDDEMEPVLRHLARGAHYRKRGLLSDDSMSSALRDLHRAETHLEKALEDLGDMREEFGQTKRYYRQINHVEEKTWGTLTDVLLSSASIYTVRGSFNDALGKVHRILAEYPSHTRALAMRGRILTAANDDDLF